MNNEPKGKGGSEGEAERGKRRAESGRDEAGSRKRRKNCIEETLLSNSKQVTLHKERVRGIGRYRNVPNASESERGQGKVTAKSRRQGTGPREIKSSTNGCSSTGSEGEIEISILSERTDIIQKGESLILAQDERWRRA